MCTDEMTGARTSAPDSDRDCDDRDTASEYSTGFSGDCVCVVTMKRGVLKRNGDRRGPEGDSGRMWV